MIDELPRRGPIPRLLSHVGLIAVGFVASGLIFAALVGLAWLSR